MIGLYTHMPISNSDTVVHVPIVIQVKDSNRDIFTSLTPKVLSLCNGHDQLGLLHYNVLDNLFPRVKIKNVTRWHKLQLHEKIYKKKILLGSTRMT
jgi:hypothetical protein